MSNSQAMHFQAQATSDALIDSSKLNSKQLVIYFYPKNNTPGCTSQGQDFRDLYSEFQQVNTEILGVSRDSLRSHENFKAKHGFPFELISDSSEELCRLFDVLKQKKNFGREYIGIERSTFLLDGNCCIVKEWRKVKVAGHANEVLEQARQLFTNTNS